MVKADQYFGIHNHAELAVKLFQTSDTWYRLLSPTSEWLSLKLYESALPSRSRFSRNVVRDPDSHRQVSVSDLAYGLIEQAVPAQPPGNTQQADRSARLSESRPKK